MNKMYKVSNGEEFELEIIDFLIEYKGCGMCDFLNSKEKDSICKECVQSSNFSLATYKEMEE